MVSGEASNPIRYYAWRASSSPPAVRRPALVSDRPHVRGDVPTLVSAKLRTRRHRPAP
jgi:hypothetical protein